MAWLRCLEGGIPSHLRVAHFSTQASTDGMKPILLGIAIYLTPSARETLISQATAYFEECLPSMQHAWSPGFAF